MKSIVTQEEALSIYNSGSEFVVKTLIEQYDEIETLKNILHTDKPKIEIEKIISELNLDINDLSVLTVEVSNTIKKLLQIIESLNEENIKLRKEIEYLKGKKKKSMSVEEKADENKDLSSEKERKTDQPAKERKSKAKKHKIKIDRTVICEMDKSQLPPDAEFKGYSDIVVQEIKIATDNVEYKREVYHSKSQGKTYIAELPIAVKGKFGPGIKSLTLILKNECNMSEPKIFNFFENFGCHISQPTISRIITKGDHIGLFHQEKAEIVKAGLESTRCQHIDGTGAIVNGQNYHVQTLCNHYYTAYFTLEHKDRLSIIDIFLCGKPRYYFFNEEAFELMKSFNISDSLISKLREENYNMILNDDLMSIMMNNLLNGKTDHRYLRIMEATLIAFYHEQKEVPVVQVLLSDDAPEYKRIIAEQALCWIHDGRKYKSLQPVIPVNQEELKKFLGRYWDYYKKLLMYKSDPNPEMANKLSLEFDELFSKETSYPALNKRIEITKSKKEEFLRVIQYPEIELHNNVAELAARVQARKRDVSLHTKTLEGTKSQDTFLTITETARKLGVSAYEYIYDRVSRINALPSLASLIPSMAH